MDESYRDCSQKKRALLDCHLCVQTNQACNCEVVLLFVVCSCEFFRDPPANARLLARCVRASRATCRQAALRRVAACQPGVAASCVWPFCTLMSNLRAWLPFVKMLHPAACCFAARPMLPQSTPCRGKPKGGNESFPLPNKGVPF